MEKANTSFKILVIDDDRCVAKLTQTVLMSGGYEVITATDASVGLEIAMKDKPDLILLDVMMPVINGYNICRLMKSDEGHKAIPIILMTSRAEEEDFKIGKEVGADAYIVKPYDTGELLRKVGELL